MIYYTVVCATAVIENIHVYSWLHILDLTRENPVKFSEIKTPVVKLPTIVNPFQDAVKLNYDTDDPGQIASVAY